MLPYVSIFVSQLLVFLAASAAALYSEDGPVQILTPDNFDSLVDDAPIPSVVEYYAPWCGHCQAFAPQYTKAAENLKGLVNVGAVDCNEKENAQLCRDAGVSGFPTIKIFPPSKKKNPYTGKWDKLADDYKGDRKAKDIVNAALATLTDKYISKISSADEFSSFEEAAGQLPRVVLFTSKSRSTSLYQSLSLRYRGRAAFAEVHEAAEAVVSRFDVTSFPTLIVITKDGEKNNYAGALKPLDLIAFIDQYAQDAPAGANQEDTGPNTRAPSSEDEAPRPVVAVARWSVSDMQQRMEQEGLWLLGFYKGSESDTCDDSFNQLNKAVLETNTAIMSAAAVKVLGDEVSAVRQYVDTEGWKEDPCQLQIALMPHEDKENEEWPVYKGELKGKPLQEWALEHYPNLVSRLTGEIVDSYLLTERKTVPKVVLFTTKAMTPAIYVALAYNMRHYKLMFTDINSADPALQARFQVKKVPALLLTVYDEGPNHEGAGFRILNYPGPLKYHYMLGFLHAQAEAMGILPDAPDGATSGPQDAQQGLVEITEQADFEEHCGQMALCAMTALDPRSDDFPKHLDLLIQVQQQHGSDLLQWLWIDAPAYPSFVQHFGILPAATPAFVLLSPKTLRYKLMTGSFSAAAISRTLQEVLSGKTSVVPLDDLPKVVKEDVQQAVEDEPLDEEFDLADILSEEVDSSVGKTKEERLKEVERKLKEEEEQRKQKEKEQAEAEKKAKKKKSKKKKKKSKKKPSGSKDEL